MKMHCSTENLYVSVEKCVFKTRISGGARIWDHAKMRGRGASKTGMERKPGPWWSGEKILRVPIVQGVATPFRLSWPLLLSEFMNWFASTVQKSEVGNNFPTSNSAKVVLQNHPHMRNVQDPGENKGFLS